MPAFYSRWFMNRLEAGFADVANPFNPRQIRHVDLRPEAVDAIIFWTRNPRPLFKYLDQINYMGYHYYFFYTITGYPKELEPNLPQPKVSVDAFRELSQKIGSKRVIWRYDPIDYSSITGSDFHKRNFEMIAMGLAGSTEKVIISFVDPYKKTLRRIEKMAAENGIGWHHKDSVQKEMMDIAEGIRGIADSYKIKIQSCAEDFDLSDINIPMGSCIDFEHLNSLFGLDLKYKKDPHQRPKCLCHMSVDIGAYNTCAYRCIYCYANSSFDAAAANLKKFDISSTSLYNLPQGIINK